VTLTFQGHLEVIEFYHPREYQCCSANDSRENRCESLTFDPKISETRGHRPLIFTFFYSADEYSRFGEYEGGRSSRSRDINHFLGTIWPIALNSKQSGVAAINSFTQQERRCVIQTLNLITTIYNTPIGANRVKTLQSVFKTILN
jgi:hypothetical protein